MGLGTFFLRRCPAPLVYHSTFLSRPVETPCIVFLFWFPSLLGFVLFHHSRCRLRCIHRVLYFVSVPVAPVVEVLFSGHVQISLAFFFCSPLLKWLASLVEQVFFRRVALCAFLSILFFFGVRTGPLFYMFFRPCCSFDWYVFLFIHFFF